MDIKEGLLCRIYILMRDSVRARQLRGAAECSEEKADDAAERIKSDASHEGIPDCPPPGEICRDSAANEGAVGEAIEEIPRLPSAARRLKRVSSR